MSIWTDAGAIIDATFADGEVLTYTGAGLVGQQLPAIRIDDEAPDLAGPGNTLRTIIYEVAQSLLPQRPDKSNTFIHRGHNWKVEQAKRRDDIGKWWLYVVDLGAAE